MDRPHAPTASDPRVSTVSQLTRRLRGHLESGFGDTWVRGEISNYKVPSSGHAYLVLKDAGAQLRTCLFRPVLSRTRFLLKDGMEVLVHGKVTVYEPRGEYQLIGDVVEPVGAGALTLAFEQLKAKLQAEGLFDPKHKKPLPSLPRCIGVITSQTGAAIRDILNVLARRFPDRQTLLFHAAVQGDKAADEIVAALDKVERWNTEHPSQAIEVLIVGRGGGSLEDLWPFNEERVARALHRCSVPTVSAVGHETDFTISDFVADVRAPTPSAAAELAVPRKSDLVYQVRSLESRLVRGMQRTLEPLRLHLLHLSRRLISPQQRLVAIREAFLQTTKRLHKQMRDRVEWLRQRTARATGRLDALSPLKVLGRGYSLTYRNKQLVRNLTQVAPGDRLETRLGEGVIESEVLSVAPVQG